MRDYLDAILSFIGASSLTDLEFGSLSIESASLNLETYEALLGVVDSRELLSNTRDRLRAYFIAAGVSVPSSDQGKSNIYVGSEL